ncbi:MAG: SMI1/KNR4 family protein [Terracidiphilus sp.]|jgi:hypothetical protein
MISEAVKELQAELAKSDGGSLHPASEDDIRKAELFGFPNMLVDFYREYAPDAADGRVELDQRIWSVQNAIEENKDYVPGAELFPLGYVVFASNKFGDAYCIDTVHIGSSGEYSIVLFPHDAIEEGASLEDVEQFRLTVATTLEDFLWNFARRTLVEKARYR